MNADFKPAGLAIACRTVDGATVLELTGYIDLSNVQLLTEAIDGAMSGARDLRIDLGGLTFVDSTGIRELVAGYHRAEAAGVGYRIAHAEGHVRQVLEMTGLLAFLTDGVNPRG